MKLVTSTLLAAALTLSLASAALAQPTGQIWIPSPDVKALGEFNASLYYYGRFTPKADAGANTFDLGVTAGLLPFESLKLEVGVDYLTTNFQSNNEYDKHPFYFNAKLGTPEDLGVKGMPAFAVGVYNLGTFDKPEVGVSTRQNLAYGLVAKTFPVVGRFSVGGYYGAQRALATAANPKNNNSGVMASWDRTMSEISDKLWLGVDYMSGNNANGEISIGGSWTFTKNITFLTGVVFFNPFYKPSAAGDLPGGKPAFTTQLSLNF